MNGYWSDYRINQLHRQEKMREAEMHRLGLVARGVGTAVSNRLAFIISNITALLA